MLEQPARLAKERSTVCVCGRAAAARCGLVSRNSDAALDARTRARPHYGHVVAFDDQGKWCPAAAPPEAGPPRGRGNQYAAAGRGRCAGASSRPSTHEVPELRRDRAYAGIDFLQEAGAWRGGTPKGPRPRSWSISGTSYDCGSFEVPPMVSVTRRVCGPPLLGDVRPDSAPSRVMSALIPALSELRLSWTLRNVTEPRS